jgi:hypothetical protein
VIEWRHYPMNEWPEDVLTAARTNAAEEMPMSEWPEKVLDAARRTARVENVGPSAEDVSTFIEMFPTLDDDGYPVEDDPYLEDPELLATLEDADWTPDEIVDEFIAADPYYYLSEALTPTALGFLLDGRIAADPGRYVA